MIPVMQAASHLMTFADDKPRCECGQLATIVSSATVLATVAVIASV
jgi:hypothetical protein